MSTSFSRPRKPWHRDDRGQALVEFALVATPLLLIVLGLIDFGSIYSNAIGVRQGVSDTARQAAVGQFGTNSTCTLSGAAAFPVGVKQLMCLAHSSDGIGGDNSTRISVIVGDSGANPATNTYQAGTPVTICEQYALSSVTGIFSRLLSGHVLTSITAERIETANTTNPLSTGTTKTQYSENALGGGSWSFCSAPAPDA